MRCGHGNDHRGLTELHRADAMPQNDATEFGPASTCLIGEITKAGDHLILECFVLDVGNTSDAIGMVADQPAEQDNRTAIRSSHPLGRDAHIEHMLGAGDPGVNVGRRYRHAVMVVGGAVPDAWHPTSVREMAPPDSPDDDNVFGSQPHPDDRLWRHPSETGPAASEPIKTSQVTAGPRRSRSLTLPLILIAVVLGSGLTVLGLSVSGALDPPPARVVVEKVETDAGTTAPLDTVVERLRPSIVQVEVTRGTSITTATGVIYRSDGYVITTADAVTNADSIRVILSDGRAVSARVVGVDLVDDVAVLSINAADITPVVLGNAESLAPGTQAIVLSVDSSATSPTAVNETISAKGQRFDAADGSTLHDMIGTRTNGVTFDDALLCAPNGAVLGIFTTRSPEYVNGGPSSSSAPDIRFATPIKFAVQIADDIIATGSVHQPWLGVMSEDVDTSTAARLGRSGTVVTEIAAGGPAETAGLAKGDIIVSIDDAPVTSATNLVVVLRPREIGSTIAITYIRDGAQRTTTATLTNRP